MLLSVKDVLARAGLNCNGRQVATDGYAQLPTPCRKSRREARRDCGPERWHDRRVTIRDVARAAGVSLGTVSNVLNNQEVVAAPTRRRVLETIAETGFVRSTAAHELRAGRSHTMGMIVLDLAIPFIAEIVKGAEEVLSDSGYGVVVCSSEESLEQENHYLRALEERRVEGLLIAPAEDDLSALCAVARRGVPTVLLDRDGGPLGLCSVTVDDVRGGDLVASYLLELGHGVVGFVNGPLSVHQCADIRQGVRKAFRRRGLRIADALVEVMAPALSIDDGEKAAGQLLTSKPLPTAVMCGNDLLALGVWRGLTSAGVAVPHDVALVGYNDTPFVSVLTPPLSSVRRATYELGESAAMLLLDEVSHRDHEHRSLRFEPQLVVRASSG